MKSKWEPLGHYTFSDFDYIVFARRCRNGLIKFKTKKVQSGRYVCSNYFIPRDLINIKEQWNIIMKQGEAEIK